MVLKVIIFLWDSTFKDKYEQVVIHKLITHPLINELFLVVLLWTYPLKTTG